METTLPTSLAATWQQQLLAHALRLVAASQTVYVVVLHAAWILLLTMAMTNSAAGDGVTAAGQALLDAFRWLGGVDVDGHGGVDEVMTVWAKLSVVVYLGRLAIGHVRGPRARWSLLRMSLLSAVIALAGFASAMALLGPASKGSPAWFVLAMAFATFLATGWAVAVAGVTDALILRIDKRPRIISGR